MTPAINPMTSYILALEMTRITLEAQAVIALRTMGMVGLWATRPHEVTRMVREKPEALTEAWFAAARAMMGGKGMDGIAHAWLRPIGGRTRSNARRLARLGPPTLHR